MHGRFSGENRGSFIPAVMIYCKRILYICHAYHWAALNEKNVDVYNNSFI